MSCEQLQLLGPLVDGELAADKVQALSLHVAACPACTAELDELRAVSRLVSAARRSNMGRMPDEAMDRLRLHVQGLIETADVGLVWMARVFSGVAASVLIAGIWLLSQPARTGIATSDPVPQVAPIAMPFTLEPVQAPA
jgi:anti-sigma factor RsiW